MSEPWHIAEPWCPIPNEEPTVWDEEIECPDCDEPIPLGSIRCGHCGLTMVEIADRLARSTRSHEGGNR